MSEPMLSDEKEPCPDCCLDGGEHDPICPRRTAENDAPRWKARRRKMAAGYFDPIDVPSTEIQRAIDTRDCDTCHVAPGQKCHSLTSGNSYDGAWFIHKARRSPSSD